MKRMLITLMTLGAVAALSAPAAVAQSDPIRIAFVKTCPAFTCTGTSPVEVETEVTSFWQSGESFVFHLSAAETLSSGSSSVTVRIHGILNSYPDPNLVVMTGTVTSGSWQGTQLTGARVHVLANRVGSTSTFAGTMTILPGSAG
jgi:hypothetical protein